MEKKKLEMNQMVYITVYKLYYTLHEMKLEMNLKDTVPIPFFDIKSSALWNFIFLMSKNLISFDTDTMCSSWLEVMI